MNNLKIGSYSGNQDVMLSFALLLAAVVGWAAGFDKMEPLDGEVEGRIWNGRNASPGQFPYQVLLSMQLNEGNAFCGGSLISTNYVLTAAHCCANVSQTIVYLGMVNIEQMNDTKTVKLNVSSQDMIIHEQYDPDTVENDICLLRLPSTVQTNANISTVALPTQQDTNPSKYNLNAANISGWGQTNDFQGLSRRLEWTTVLLEPHSLCALTYVFLNKFTNTQLCSSKFFLRWSGPCRGDSGGPLTVPDSTGKPVEIGIVSWGVGGCALSLPVVYTYVPAYVDWIKQHMT